MATATHQQHPTDIPLHAIPLQMIEAPRWVCWKLETVKGKSTKVPYSPRTGRKASTTNPRTWSTYAAAAAMLAHSSEYDGLGFVLGDGIAGIDLDHCVTDGEQLTAAASGIVETIDSYSEISQSGTGVHIYLLGEWTGTGTGRKRDDKEAYGHGRFFAVTGNQLPGTPSTLEPRQTEFEAFIAQYLPAAPEPEKKCQNDKSDDGGTLDLEDAQVCFQAGGSLKEGLRFHELWSGGNDGLKSDSEGDLALCGILIRAGASSEEQIDRLFRTSQRTNLANGKWDRRDGTYGSYGARTIAKAILTSEGVKLNQSMAEPAIENVKMTNSGETPSGEVLYLRRELEKAKARIAELEQENSLLKRTYGNTKLSPTLRAGADCLRREWIKKAEVNPTTGRKELLLFTDGVAKNMGVSAKTVAAVIQNYEMGGHLHTRPAKKVSEFGPNKGRRMDRIILELDEEVFLEKVEMLTSSSPKKPGGSIICPGCEKRHLKAKTTYTCLECGTVWETAERYLHPDQDYGESEAETKNVILTNSDDVVSDDQETNVNIPPLSTVRILGNNDKNPLAARPIAPVRMAPKQEKPGKSDYARAFDTLVAAGVSRQDAETQLREAALVTAPVVDMWGRPVASSQQEEVS